MAHLSRLSHHTAGGLAALAQSVACTARPLHTPSVREYAALHAA